MTPASLRRCCLMLLLLAIGAPLRAAPAGAGPSAAFFYGANPPTELLSQFDWAVVDPAQIGPSALAALRGHGAQVFAYLSVGEATEADLAAAGVSPELVRAKNPDWRTAVLDLAAPAWHDHVVRRADALWSQGYRALFLDTLDSYRLFATTEVEARRQQDALVALIGELAQRHPGVQLLLNRGFEVLERVHGQVVGVAAESLFGGWDPAGKRYRPVAADEREQLLVELRKVRENYRLPVVVIDYLPAADRAQARELAARIDALGFVPWVATSDLDSMGVGAIEAMPRKVLMLYASSGPGDDLAFAAVNADAAVPLEYLGYSPEYLEAHAALPAGQLRGRYAGIVLWFSGAVPNSGEMVRWLEKQVADGVPIALLGYFGLPADGALMHALGLTAVQDIAPDSFTIVHRDAMTGFEGFPEVPPISGGGFRAARADVTEHLLIEDAHHSRFATVLTAPWGGIALAPWVIEGVREGGDSAGDDAVKPGGDDWRERWILDPFAFFRTALHLPDMPVPDPTTENGSRILTAHIDGDGFVNRAELPGNPYSAEVILDRVLKRHPLPTTVSVIESEVSAEGLYPTDAKSAQAIARQIFRLPFVEIASHTFSHPFDWLAEREGAAPVEGDLAPAGYRYSVAREIDGSVHFIDQQLAPPDKKTRMLLWSGNALPPAEALARTEKLGLGNMNGGDSSRSIGDNTLASVSPMTRSIGGYTQVYAPVTNENVYTNGYTGPLWGFEHAIQTFQLTDLPRRLKPMTIYYHLFSGSHGGSLAALERVYRYAERQETLPMYESQYARTVLAFGDLGIARSLDGSWRISGARELRTLRLPSTLGWPDLRASPGVAGVRELPQGRYLALSGAERSELRLTGVRGAGPTLDSANGRIVDWRRDGGALSFRLRGEVPLRVALSGVAAGCTVNAPNARVSRSAERVVLSYQQMDSGNATIHCQ